MQRHCLNSVPSPCMFLKVVRSPHLLWLRAGHLYKMAQAAVEGAKEVEGVEVTFLQVRAPCSTQYRAAAEHRQLRRAPHAFYGAIDSFWMTPCKALSQLL